MARQESRSDSFRTNMPRFCGGNFWRWRSMGLPRCFQQPIDRLNVARVDVLGDVSLKNQLPRPLKSDTDLLLEPRQFHQVNGAPQHPSDNSGKLEPEDPGNTRAPADRCKLPGRLVHEGSCSFSFQAGADVLSGSPALTKSVLGGRRVGMF